MVTRKKQIFIIMLLFTNLVASQLQHSISNQGYTGIINTPNASVINEGDLLFHFDNQFDNVLRSYDYGKSYKSQEDYIFGIGLFPHVEILGRLSEAKGYQRDLSANIKLEIPYKHKYLPNIALGLQDLGGAANKYGNQYVVLDKEFYFLRVSLGYGHSNAQASKRKRMDGLFGGVEVKTFDCLYLLLEDDSREQFMGVRLHMPQQWSSYFKLNTLISSNLRDDYKTSISVNLTFPLYKDKNRYMAPTKEALTKREDEERNEPLKSFISTQTIAKKEQAQEKYFCVDHIRQELVSLGLENITIATKENNIYLAYENSVFLFNDLDAMGVVIGLLNKTRYKTFVLEQKRSKTTVVTIKGDLDKAREFYANPTILTKKLFAESLKKHAPLDISTYNKIVVQANDSFLKPKLEFTPLVKTFIGNEFGLFNYKLWLRTKVIVNLYKGIDFSAVGDIHIADSKIQSPKYDWYSRLFERGSHMESVMLHLSNNSFTGVNTVSFGTLEENFAGAMNQYIYNVNNHTFKLKLGYFEQFQNGDLYKENFFGKIGIREVYLAKYSYFFKDYDTLSEVNFGKYWNQDFGFNLKIKRFFDDVAVYLTYEQSEPYFKSSNLSERSNKFIGIGLELPLTLRHTQNYKYGQIRGTNALNYNVKSTILRKDGSNTLVSGANNDPEIALSSENYFYNRNRLQTSYIQAHAFRFVEAFEKYLK